MPAISLAALEDLERRFDGPIPPALLSNQTELELMIEHHRAMVRFSEARMRDFTDALARLKAAPPGPATRAWIARTEATIADHARAKIRHLRDLTALTREWRAQQGEALSVTVPQPAAE